MERLTYRDISGIARCKVFRCMDKCEYCDHYRKILNKVAHYEDLEKEGKLIVLASDKKTIRHGELMKADKNKLKNSTKADLIHEISLVNEELSNEMYPPSWARTKELLEYKDELIAELKIR